MVQTSYQKEHENEPALNIPLIDVTNIALHSWDNSVTTDPNVAEEAREIYNAMTSAGFLYLKGHGISEADITEAFRVSQDFFESTRSGADVIRRSGKDLLGFIDSENEAFDKSRPKEIKMAYDICPNTTELRKLPKHVREPLEKFYHTCHELSFKLIRSLALSMGKEDLDFFVHGHKHVGSADENSSNLRTLYYPAVKDTKKLPIGQQRCGKHADFGTITLLFQTAPGLEAQNAEGEFVPIEPIPGTIVVNIGDMLQQWSNGELRSTVHRVVQQQSTEIGSSLKCRQSIAFFLHPDFEQVIGGVSVQEHVRRRNVETFHN